MMEKYFEANKKLWNERTPIHVNSEFYSNDEFIAGKNSLNKIELDEIGDVKGKSVLHLQCHFGQDTISFARMGAKATGVDFSDEAIENAKKINEKCGTDAEFINCNIYDLKNHLDEKFDIIFTSYGVIGWLPDLNEWANLINHFLKPGGVFYIIEFHPMVWMFDDNFERFDYSYFTTSEPIEISSTTTYASSTEKLQGVTEYSWNHALSETINALIQADLKIEFLNEFPFSPYNIFPDMYKEDDGYWRMKKFGEKLPLLFSIKAKKP
jgi:ubiquinone/menaquinone biosynthesis C-methylase UbiE